MPENRQATNPYDEKLEKGGLGRFFNAEKFFCSAELASRVLQKAT
jgi:hypothetical protein